MVTRQADKRGHTGKLASERVLCRRHLSLCICLFAWKLMARKRGARQNIDCPRGDSSAGQSLEWIGLGRVERQAAEEAK